MDIQKAIADLRRAFSDLELVLIESGGDNLAATFSRSWPTSPST